MDNNLLQKAKMKILLQNVQGYESNSQFANYYASDYVHFREKGYFEDVEARIEAVTPADIARVARQYLSLEKGIVIVEKPTLTLTQFYLFLGLLAVALIVVAFYLYARTHKRIIRRK